MTQLPVSLAPLQALSESIASTVDRIAKSTVSVRGRGRHALGSGVVWRDGLLVTAAHIFGRAPAAASIVTAQGARADITLVGTDAPTDLALFRLPDSDLPAAALADAAAVRTGQLAVLVGRSQDGDLTASLAMINRASGAWQTWLGGHLDRLIRLDGGVHDGLSGGPVANAAGAVFGIATSALSRTYGTVVPESTVARVVDELLAKGHVARAFLGISAQSVAVSRVPGSAPIDGAPSSGLLITSLLPDGPAAQAGVLVGDIVVDVADQRAASLPDLRHSLATHIGKNVRISLIRGGLPAEVVVTVGQWPTEARAC
jgi:S1-C subfamily serine protease